MDRYLWASLSYEDQEKFENFLLKNESLLTSYNKNNFEELYDAASTISTNSSWMYFDHLLTEAFYYSDIDPLEVGTPLLSVSFIGVNLEDKVITIKPENGTEIPMLTFADTVIKKLVLKEGILNIKEDAFAGAQIDALVLPYSIESIEQQGENDPPSIDKFYIPKQGLKWYDNIKENNGNTYTDPLAYYIADVFNMKLEDVIMENY